MSDDRRIPSAALGDFPTRCLLAVLAVPNPSARSVADTAGLVSTSSSWYWPTRLRRLGLVEWEDGQKGTLRPAVRAVPFGTGRR